MSAVVKIGDNEVVFSGSYTIPINTPHINIYLQEQDFTFKISFEEVLLNENEKANKKRLQINKATGDIVDVKFTYHQNETGFKSTRHPNNLFFSIDRDRKVKVQYHYNLDFNVDRKNSIALQIQITKSPEMIYEENENGEENDS